jgi:hypothetical protein
MPKAKLPSLVKLQPLSDYADGKMLVHETCKPKYPTSIYNMSEETQKDSKS